MNKFPMRFSFYFFLCLSLWLNGCVLGTQNITSSLELQNPECDLTTGTFDLEEYKASFPETWAAVNAVILELGETIKVKNDATRTIKTEVSQLFRLAQLSQGMNQMEYSMHIRINESFEQQGDCKVILTVGLVDNQSMHIEDIVESQPEKIQLKRVKDAKEAIGRLFFCKLTERLRVRLDHLELHSHVVKRGDTLSEISTKYYGTKDHWRQLADYNNLKRPYGMTPGDILQIPDTVILGEVKTSRKRTPIVSPPLVPIYNKPPQVIKDTRDLHFTSSYNNSLATTMNSLDLAFANLGVGVKRKKRNSIRSNFLTRPTYKFQYNILLAATETGTNINISCKVEARKNNKIGDVIEGEINQYTFERLFPVIDQAIEQLSLGTNN